MTVMKQPTYKPEAWVLYQQESTGGYGHIIGASFNGEVWLYTVAGPQADGSHATVREDEITQILQNGSWLAISVSAASSSAYQDA